MSRCSAIRLRCARARRDQSLIPHMERVWQFDLQAYGADKVWRQMTREGVEVARCMSFKWCLTRMALT